MGPSFVPDTARLQNGGITTTPFVPSFSPIQAASANTSKTQNIVVLSRYYRGIHEI